MATSLWRQFVTIRWRAVGVVPIWQSSVPQVLCTFWSHAPINLIKITFYVIWLSGFLFLLIEIWRMSFIEYQFYLFQNNCATSPFTECGSPTPTPRCSRWCCRCARWGWPGSGLLTSDGVSTDGAHCQHLPHPRRGRGALHHRLPSLLQGDGYTHTCCCCKIIIPVTSGDSPVPCHQVLHPPHTGVLHSLQFTKILWTDSCGNE